MKTWQIRSGHAQAWQPGVTGVDFASDTQSGYDARSAGEFRQPKPANRRIIQMNPLHYSSRRRTAAGLALAWPLGLLLGINRTASAQATTAGDATLSPAQMERMAGDLPATGSKLALPEVALLGGGQFRPAQAIGQVTVVYWWASTCPFCAQQSPEIQKLWQSQQGKGLQMLALSVDRQPEEALAYLHKKGYTFPSAWVSAEVHRRLPKPRGLPVTLVLGRDGKVLQAEKGQMFAEDVAQMAQWLQ
jgi:hypothetical protein